jgi:type III secretion protein V
MLKHTSADMLLACVVLSVVGMMILPLPTMLLDVLVAANIAVAVLLLLVAMYVRSGLELSAFPTILLVTTLYRLALNVASTRLILLQADAGEVIARSVTSWCRATTWWAPCLPDPHAHPVPGHRQGRRACGRGGRALHPRRHARQADVDRRGAAQRRPQPGRGAQRAATIQRESQFYGAMDGAMKFVKGDAIAGIVITVINVLGGLVIGVMQRDLSAADSLRIYGLLTIGDGLVSQIPALLISTAAGLVVTRVASEDADASLGRDVASQVFGHPRPPRAGTCLRSTPRPRSRAWVS